MHMFEIQTAATANLLLHKSTIFCNALLDEISNMFISTNMHIKNHKNYMNGYFENIIFQTPCFFSDHK